MNRAMRRKHFNKVATDVLKGRKKLMEKKQWGIGLVLTNRVLAITFGPWTWIPWDRR